MRDLTDAPEAETAPRETRRRRRLLSPSSSLIGRIVFINMIGLVLMVAGVMYLNQFRSGLIELRAQALATQGEIIAVALAENNAALGDPLEIEPEAALRAMRRLAQPLNVRARLFDRTGRLVGDTRGFDAGRLTVTPLPPPGGDCCAPPVEWLERAYDAAVSGFVDQPPLYQETQIFGVTTQPEVYDALRGQKITGVHVNDAGELIVAVSLPIQRFKAVQGALVLSTEGGDIDSIVIAERRAILRVFLVALGVSVALSVMLAAGIAQPLRRLADAARASGRRGAGAGARFAFPDMTARADEIGALSGALLEMADALQSRIEGIERFAADVAHEIKAPLTSVRSAVETLRRSDDPDARARLLRVIEQDVRRLDRLVTDISNASRLDAELAREDMAEVDVAALLRTVVDVIGDPRVSIDTGRGPLRCRGLDGRLAQIFVNLIENALSFSPPDGAVRVRARRTGDDWLRVTVDDDGPGIAEEKLEAVFERFYSDRAEGEGEHSGLGLSISRVIAGVHGGRVWAENRVDAAGAPVGARLVVMLPT